MKIGSKIVLAAAIATTAICANKKIGGQELVIHTENEDKYIAGYNYDLTGEKVYGTETPVSYSLKYMNAWIGDFTFSMDRADKWYTQDESENWTVWKFEITKGEDDAWFAVEFGG